MSRNMRETKLIDVGLASEEERAQGTACVCWSFGVAEAEGVMVTVLDSGQNANGLVSM